MEWNFSLQTTSKITTNIDYYYTCELCTAKNINGSSIWNFIIDIWLNGTYDEIKKYITECINESSENVKSELYNEMVKCVCHNKNHLAHIDYYDYSRTMCPLDIFLRDYSRAVSSSKIFSSRQTAIIGILLENNIINHNHISDANVMNRIRNKITIDDFFSVLTKYIPQYRFVSLIDPISNVTLLHIVACERHTNRNYIKFLLDCGIDPTIKSNKQQTVLNIFEKYQKENKSYDLIETYKEIIRMIKQFVENYSPDDCIYL